MRYVVGEDGLGGARVGLKKSDFLSFFLFSIGLGYYIISICLVLECCTGFLEISITQELSQ